MEIHTIVPAVDVDVLEVFEEAVETVVVDIVLEEHIDNFYFE